MYAIAVAITVAITVTIAVTIAVAIAVAITVAFGKCDIDFFNFFGGQVQNLLIVNQFESDKKFQNYQTECKSQQYSTKLNKIKYREKFCFKKFHKILLFLLNYVKV